MGLGQEINILFECLMRRWFFKSVDASILEKSKSKFLLQWNYLLILKNLFSNPLAPQFLLWKCKKKTAFDPEKPYRKTTVTGKFGTISLHQIRNEHWRSKTHHEGGIFLKGQWRDLGFWLNPVQEIKNINFLACWAISNRDMLSAVTYSSFSVFSIYEESNFLKEIIKNFNL
jgi:hypothetical protein